MTDSRGKNTQLPMADLLRQAVYSRLPGYEEQGGIEQADRGEFVEHKDVLNRIDRLFDS